MNYMKPSVELLNEHDPLLKLERCIRVAYKSEDKIGEGSAAKIVKAVIKRGHTSTLEHYRIKLLCSGYIGDAVQEYKDARGTVFIKVTPEGDDEYDTTLCGNLRAFMDLINDSRTEFNTRWFIQKCLHEAIPGVFAMDDCPAKEFDWKAVKFIGEDPNYFTVHIVTDRGVLQEIARNRSQSSTVESTRFCNYSGNGISICLPEPYDWSPNPDGNYERWVDDLLLEWSDDDSKKEYFCNAGGVSRKGIYELIRLAKVQTVFDMSMRGNEFAYNELLALGEKPQSGRSVLPNALKTEMYLTATYEAWDHFIKLRSAPDAHPQIRIISDMIKQIKEDLIANKEK